MRTTDADARSRATVSSHSLLKTLVVALVVSLAPLAATAALTVTGLTVAFLGGALTGTVVAVARRGRRRRQRDASTRSTALGGA